MLKKNLFGDTEAYLIFEFSVINKKYGHNIELARRQYSGIGSSSCLRSISCANMV
jgi:hypothetical protein